MATTPAKRACPECGTLIPEEAEFCPVCALQGALSPEKTESLSDISSELYFEHYQVLKNEDGTPTELGHGGMGVTYKAIDTRLRCLVALKIIGAQFIGNESARSRFLREARAAASVHHPNVATVHHLGESGGNYFYAMEFVDGETLQALIRRRGPLELELALEIVRQATAGLAAINKLHLVHRDIKPSNIMLSWEEGHLENVKIIDLGLAKGGTEDTLSIAGSFIGTPAYASPEQFAGLGTDIRSDLYSLAVTLWEMLSGKPPFHGSAAELMDQHQHADPPIEKLKNVPAPVIALLQVLLEKDPGKRFQTSAQLHRALTKVREAVSSGLGLTADELRSAGELVAVKSSKAKPRRQPIRWVVGSGLCVAAAATAWFFLSGHAAFLFNQPTNKSIPAEKSVAVLPFESLSETKSDAYFADGVQDEILNNLAKIAQLKVISRTSVMQYRADTKRDLRQIANALGVANVLEGTVRRDGNHVRVSTELVDASNDNTIWADSYDRDLTDIFAIQSEIAQAVASRLTAKLSAKEREDIWEKPTSNLQAYDLYLQAKELIGPKSVGLLPGDLKGSYSKALGLLEQATEKDHGFVLAYCLIAKAHDSLYDNFFRTPERRVLGDSAVAEALRLRPDLAEAHLAAAFHLFYGYRDIERARVQIAIAAQTLPNNSDLLQLRAEIDEVHGRWEQATADLERAATLDPRNPEVLNSLASHYGFLRRYREKERVLDRLIELEPDQPELRVRKPEIVFLEKGDVKGVRSAYEALPPSMRNDVYATFIRAYLAMCARDFAAAEEIVSETPNEEIIWTGALVPRQIGILWVEFIRGNHPTVERFGAAREQLEQKVAADPADPYLMVALALADLALGRTEESIKEGRRAMEMRPISEDAVAGPAIAANVSLIYVWTNQLDVAFDQLDVLVQMPSDFRPNYGDLKTYPGWDPLRKDPRFDKLLAKLAPRD